MAIKFIEPTDEEKELQMFVKEFSLFRVIKILQSRQRQLDRQRSAEYRAQQAAKARLAREADKAKIARLQQKMARMIAKNPELDDELDIDDIQGENAA